MEAEGVTFVTDAHIGANVPATKLKEFDAVVLCGGATKPRDLPIPGRDLDGVHFAMDFLTQSNKRVAGDELNGSTPIMATDKNVIVIGGGDTGSDCIGTSNRHKATSITNFELFGKPTSERPANQPWPYWPMRLRTSTSHDEGCDREWAVLTKEFVGENGKLTGLKTVQVRWVPNFTGGRPMMEEIAGTEKEWPAELVLLAMGFLGPETNTMVDQLGLELDGRGNVKCDASYMSNVPGIFSAGDMRRGQSLIVWAISEGREAAHHADRYLTGDSELPTKGGVDLPRV
jgi:glutamate synthase (NADPH/NADH) small chain